LVRYLAVNIGKEINLNTLTSEVGIHRETLKSYLNILEECYIISRIRPFHKNLSTELKKTPKVYFIDPGIRNILVNDLKGISSRQDRGELFENFVYLNLLAAKERLSEIKYWKTKNKQEIDFIVTHSGQIYALEAKFSGSKQISFKAFQNAYPGAICRTVCYSNSNRSPNDLFGWQRLIP
jgi:predicted AAA+ superfamily ATPase